MFQTDHLSCYTTKGGVYGVLHNNLPSPNAIKDCAHVGVFNERFSVDPTVDPTTASQCFKVPVIYFTMDWPKSGNRLNGHDRTLLVGSRRRLVA